MVKTTVRHIDKWALFLFVLNFSWLFWLFISWVDVILHNVSPNGGPSLSWNFFVYMIQAGNWLYSL